MLAFLLPARDVMLQIRIYIREWEAAIQIIELFFVELGGKTCVKNLTYFLHPMKAVLA